MNYIRKTKIVCTLGPASNSKEVITELVKEGMDVARLNFSHGSYEDKIAIMNIVKEVRKELKKPVAILLDTKGPEVRIGTFKDHSIEIVAGQTFTLTTEDIEGTNERVSISYKELPKDVSVDSTILIDDGLVEFRVLKVTDTDIVCTAINGGTISDRKGVNLPDVNLSMPFISKKDHDDILFGIEQEVDFIAASFVRSAADVEDILEILRENNCNTINIISKIENRQGVENIDEIIRVSDGVMVARGDMGVEIPLEEVPIIQKKIIDKVYSEGKQVITATQMLDSMIKNPRPTRAEATDVANAIYDGTSAIMLSGETAAGKYPIESLKTMVKLAVRTEQDIDYHVNFKEKRSKQSATITDAISHATVTTAEDLRVGAIITVTKSGYTAKMVSRYRPSCPIIGCSTSEQVTRQLNLAWGITPLLVDEQKTTDDLYDTALDTAIENGLISVGDMAVFTAGLPLGVSGTTNMIKVHVAGHVLVKGTGVSGESVSGSLCVCKNEKELKRKYNEGDIIVIPETSNDILPLIKTCSGLITEDSSSDSHAAIVGLTLGLPVIIGAAHASQILKSGTYVTMDAKTGIIRNP